MQPVLHTSYNERIPILMTLSSALKPIDWHRCLLAKSPTRPTPIAWYAPPVGLNQLDFFF